MSFLIKQFSLLFCNQFHLDFSLFSDISFKFAIFLYLSQYLQK